MMLKLRAGFIAAAFVAMLCAVHVTSAQTSPNVQLSDVKWRPTFGYISSPRSNADKSGRLEDDYYGEAKGYRYISPPAYDVFAKVTNNETKAIRSVGWEITYFADAAKTQSLGCHWVSLLGRISPGKTRTLRQYNAVGSKFKTTPYSTTNLLSVRYTDNTAWVSPAYLSIKRGQAQPCGL